MEQIKACNRKCPGAEALLKLNVEIGDHEGQPDARAYNAAVVATNKIVCGRPLPGRQKICPRAEEFYEELRIQR